MTLWPLVRAAQSESIVPVVMTLGSVAAGVGGNLIAEQIQRWRDQVDGASEADVETWVEANTAANADLRQALDAILEHMEAIPQAQVGLNDADRQWFTQTLQNELASFGNLARFKAHLTGSGAIAQGAGAVAAGAGGVAIGGNVQGDVIIGGVPQAVAPEFQRLQRDIESRCNQSSRNKH